MNGSWMLSGIGLVALSGLPGLFLSRSARAGEWIALFLALAGNGLGLLALGRFWFAAEGGSLALPWGPSWISTGLELDGLSAVFLLPIFLVSGLGSLYGLGYWSQARHPENGRKLRLCYGTMTAGMALLVVARDSILFLFGWEFMALSAFFLVTTEDHDPEVRQTGLLYLVATHVATLALFALFALLRSAKGSYALTPLPPGALTEGLGTALFVLALIAFGLKAGLMPLHVWLPSAHAMAPSHVSAVMSGVIIKMGVYGLVRILSLLPDPPLVWGGIILGLGVLSGVLGVVFALGQHDLKRLLAYHSIENIGIIFMGLGLAQLGRSTGRPDWVVLGLAGCLLHVWNHALFKSLLFLSAGSVIHATHTRQIDHLGGLSRAMPKTALFFLVGAVAICGLPPLNGFVSEFLVYLGLFGTLGEAQGPSLAGVAFGVPALALIGALALACFVKVYGAVFLGQARSGHACSAQESPPSMLAPMGVLALCCACIGLAPGLVAPLLDPAIAVCAPELRSGLPSLLAQAPLAWIGVLAWPLLAVLLAGGVFLRSRFRKAGLVSQPTWGCGYAVPTPRMQYTSSSFAQLLVHLFGWVLRPRTIFPTAMPLFPERGAFSSEVPDVVLDGAVWPAFRHLERALGWFRLFQQGSTQVYLLYIFLILVALLLWR